MQYINTKYNINTVGDAKFEHFVKMIKMTYLHFKVNFSFVLGVDILSDYFVSNTKILINIDNGFMKQLLHWGCKMIRFKFDLTACIH